MITCLCGRGSCFIVGSVVFVGDKKAMEKGDRVICALDIRRAQARLSVCSALLVVGAGRDFGLFVVPRRPGVEDSRPFKMDVQDQFTIFFRCSAARTRWVWWGGCTHYHAWP